MFFVIAVSFLFSISDSVLMICVVDDVFLLMLQRWCSRELINDGAFELSIVNSVVGVLAMDDVFVLFISDGVSACVIIRHVFKFPMFEKRVGDVWDILGPFVG